MEELIPTLQEEGEERIDTLQEGSIIAGVQTINGKAGDLDLKTINGQDILTPGDLSLATTEQLATKQDQLTDTQLDAVNSGIDSTKVGQIATNTQDIATLQSTKQDNLTQTQLNAVNSGIDETKVAQIATNTGNITSNTNRITTIEGKIPSTATSSNQLTDKNYVDNSIATNTANYISDNGQPFQSLADLEAYSGPLTNNDYAFVVSTDSAGNLLYTRYKYNADQELWAEEYTIANPTFTSTQWASIDSGVTANDVSQIGTNKSDIASLQSGKQDALSQTQLDAVNSGIDATKVQQIATNASNITSLQTDKQDKLIAGTNIQIASDGKTISATDTTYTAGTGLTLAGTQFSVTDPVPSGFFTDTSATQEGEGTTITLNNTTDAPIDNVELKGDTYQFTTTGKNKLAPTASFSEAHNGVTFTGDGTGVYTVTGKASAGSNSAQMSVTAYTIQDGDYLHLMNTSAVATVAFVIVFSDSSTISPTISPANRIYSLANQVGKTVDKIYLYASSATDLSSPVTITPMIVASATATSYEPYTAGASPNPSYPQQIDTVTGEQTVSVVGKNLFDISTLQKGSVTVTNGVATGTAGQFFSAFGTSTDGITLTRVPERASISIKAYTDGNASTTGNGIVIQALYTDNTIGYPTYFPNNTSSYTTKTGSSVANKTLKAIKIIYESTSANTWHIAEFSVQDYTSDTPAYEPYQSQSYEINLGKNLFDVSDAKTNAWLSSADGHETTSADPNIVSGYIRVNVGQTYVVSGISSLQYNVWSYESLSSTTGKTHLLYNSTTTRIITPDTNYIRFSIGGGDAWSIRNQVQFEAGTQATTYSAYKTPIELCKIGTYQDYIYKDGSDWKIHKEIGKVVLDGTESWTLPSQTTSIFAYALTGVFQPANDNTVAPITSSHYTACTYNALAVVDYGIANRSALPRIAIKHKDYTTSDDFKTWLTQNNVTVYYVYNTTPTDTVITDASLIAQLEALASSTTYAPQTNYTTSTPAPNLPTILTIDVFKNNYAGLLARLNKAGA